MHLPSSRTPAALLAAIVSVSLSFAAPLAARADGDAAGGVGVARLNLIQGSVAVQRGDSSSPIDAVINAPVLSGDYVTTGDAARAELQLDGSSMVRLGPGVQLRFTHLDAGNRELQLAEGTIGLRLLRAGAGRASIDTPSVSVRPRGAGSYRVSVGADGRTEVTVRSGAADIVTPQGSQELVPGTTLLASGSAASPTLTASSALADDDFDRFNRERDEREQRALATRYVDTDIQGVDDLSQYGHWVTDGSYGHVWAPYQVASDWAPYRNGRWVWEDYYGWTWVAAEPWGWAPYHYGSWYRSAAYGWCWYPPPPAYYAPAWRPALVGFISFGGGGWSLAFGNGGIGWFPLAPFEPYRPWWGRGYNNTTITNVTNVTNVTNNYYGNVNNGTVTHYRNLLTNGVTAVGAKRFTEGRFDHPVALGAAEVKRVAIVRGPVPVVPTEANLRFTQRGAATPQLAVRPALLEKTFAGNATPVRRTPFEQQRAAIANLTPHLSGTPATGTARSVAPVTTTTVTTRANPATTTTVASPWDRFAAHGATPVNHPMTNPEVTTKQHATTGGTAAHGPSDSWSRFDKTRGGTAGAASGTHAVTTVDGTAAHPTRATMTDGSTAPRTVHATRTVNTTRTADGHGSGPAREHGTTTTATTKTTHHVVQHPQAAHAPG